MENFDARKLSTEELYEKRQQVVQLYCDKTPVMSIVKSTGLSWPAVNSVIKNYEAGNALSLMPAKRGRKRGTGRVLNNEQEIRLRDIIYKKCPWQLGFRIGTRKRLLWSRDVVARLIEHQCEVTLSERVVGKYLERWGFPSIKNHLRPNVRCTGEIKGWLNKHYEEIVLRAKQENAEIYWAYKRSLDVQVSTESKWPKLNVVSAINNRGKEFWLIVKGKYSQEKQIKFLKTLSNEFRSRVFLIRDTSDYYTANQVSNWLCENNKIEIFPPQLLTKELLTQTKLLEDRKEEREFRRTLQP